MPKYMFVYRGGHDNMEDTSRLELESLRDREQMEDYLLLDCAIARIHELESDSAGAINSYLDALNRNPAPHEKALLESRLRKLAG